MCDVYCLSPSLWGWLCRYGHWWVSHKTFNHRYWRLEGANHNHRLNWWTLDWREIDSGKNSITLKYSGEYFNFMPDVEMKIYHWLLLPGQNAHLLVIPSIFVRRKYRVEKVRAIPKFMMNVRDLTITTAGHPTDRKSILAQFSHCRTRPGVGGFVQCNSTTEDDGCWYWQRSG